MHITKVQNWLWKNNIKEKIGKAAFSIVYADPNDPTICYKVVKNKLNSWDDFDYRDAYGQYVEAVKNIDNPYVPLILDVIRFGEPEDGIEEYIVVMERLQELDENDPNYGEYRYVKNIIVDIFHNDEIKITDDLSMIGKIIRECAKAVGAFIDIHSKNIMVRGNQLVITDPIA